MITKGNRRGGQPVLMQQGNALPLDRIALDSRVFNEEWIQKLIHNNPGILPVNEIESGFHPLIPIGREINTPAGYIDNLFVSPEGYLTIVETKLWRNPEARREVVGQIIDYPKELNKWNFTSLDQSVVAFNQLYNHNSDGLLATVKKHEELDESDEQMLIDNITKNLKRGRFLLLIVGDGIRESVEDMVEYLTQYPQLYFTLALIELQVYDFKKDENSFVIIPQLVTRTKEINRAIVRLEGNQMTDIKVTIETDLDVEMSKEKPLLNRRLTIAAQDYFEQLGINTNKELSEFAQKIIQDSEEMGLFIEWNTGSFSIRLPDPLGSGMKMSIVNIDKAGLFYLGYAKAKFEKLQLPLELAYNFAYDTAALLPGIKQNVVNKHTWNNYSTLADLKNAYVPFMQRMRSYVEDIKNCLQSN